MKIPVFFFFTLQRKTTHSSPAASVPLLFLSWTSSNVFFFISCRAACHGIIGVLFFWFKAYVCIHQQHVGAWSFEECFRVSIINIKIYQRSFVFILRGFALLFLKLTPNLLTCRISLFSFLHYLLCLFMFGVC